MFSTQDFLFFKIVVFITRLICLKMSPQVWDVYGFDVILDVRGLWDFEVKGSEFCCDILTRFGNFQAGSEHSGCHMNI